MHARQEIIVRDNPQMPLGAYMPSFQPAPVGPMEEEGGSILGAIWRHIWLVALFGAIGAGAAVVYLKKATPLYESEASIYCELTGPRVLSDTIGSAQRQNYLFTQAQLMTTTPLLQLAIDKPGMAEMKTWAWAKTTPMVYLREALTAEVGRKDDLIDVSIASPYADEAQQIVSNVIQAYIDYQSQDKKNGTTTVLETLKKSREDAEKEVRAYQNEMFDFQQKHPTLNFDQVFNQELSALSQQLTAAQLATIEARAKYMPGADPLQRAQRREEEIFDQYDAKLKQVMNVNITQADYSKKQADVAVKQEFLRRLDERIKDLELTKDAEQVLPSTKVIEPASDPEKPSFPRKNRTLAIATVLGALIGAGLAMLRDKADTRMKSVEEIQGVIGLPVLGVVPAMGGRRTAVARAMTVHLDPRSVVAEAYRTVRTAIYFSNGGAQIKTILVTSPEPGDGKTTSASNLAIAIAQTGRSVLLLDADFRKPTQHKNLDIKDAVGLSSVIVGRTTLDAAIQRTGVEGLDILPCGPIPANPSEILNSREFAELIEMLSMRYDHIIFDSPPVNPVTDARILAAVCDATLLVLRADKSTRQAGEHARNALMSVGGRVLGAIVNDAPKKKGYAVYGGAYYGTKEASIRPTPNAATVDDVDEPVAQTVR